jgi:hypothetical protein
MSTNKKIETILSLLEICESNLKNAKTLLAQCQSGDIVYRSPTNVTSYINPNNSNFQISQGNEDFEFVEGYFDGENMIGDNGKIYTVPQNYASKSQLVVGDKMKWSLVKDSFDGYKEVFKLTQPVLREKVIGKFVIEGNNYGAMVDGYPQLIKILKASATFAMKNLGLAIGGKVAIYVPKSGSSSNANWGAFINVVNSNENLENTSPQSSGRRIIKNSDNFEISDEENYF